MTQVVSAFATILPLCIGRAQTLWCVALVYWVAGTVRLTLCIGHHRTTAQATCNVHKKQTLNNPNLVY